MGVGEKGRGEVLQPWHGGEPVYAPTSLLRTLEEPGSNPGGRCEAEAEVAGGGTRLTAPRTRAISKGSNVQPEATKNS